MNQIWCIMMSILMCMASGIAIQPVETERRAIVRFSDENGGVVGVLHFLQRVPTGPVHITGSIAGLEPGKKGMHVHANGDCTQAGVHFQQRHGLPGDPNRHVGDLGNILASVDGVAIVDIVDEIVSLNGPHNIIGRSVIIDSVEDLGLPEDTPPIYPSRVACGIIGVIEA